MTLPTLTAKYNKNLTITRLKRQYSLYQQAKMLISPNINTTFTGGNAEEAIKFYKKFYAPYIKSTSIAPSANNIGVLVGLNDGSGMILWSRKSDKNYGDFEYLTFCPRYKDCKEIQPRIAMPEASADGVKSFMLYASNGSLPSYHEEQTDKTRDALKSLCQTTPAYCINLIIGDGWEIKNDYPFIDKFKR